MTFLIVLLALVFVALVLYRLALSDIFFGTCPQGQIKVITKGGSYHDFFHSVGGWKKFVDKEKDGLTKLKKGEESRGPLHFLTGLYWIGIWPVYKVHGYKFEWETIKDGKIVTRSESVNTIYFRFEYPLEFKDLETKDNFKVAVVMQVLTETFCPELALFKARNWLNVLKASIESKVRDFIGTYTFEDIRGKKTEVSSDLNDFVKQIVGLSVTTGDDTNPGFEDTIGTRIISANFQRIDAADSGVTEALEAVAKAERAGQAKIVTAKKEARAAVVTAIGNARANKIKATGEQALLDATTLHVAKDPAAAKIAAIGALPKTLTTLIQEGAVNVSVGGSEKK